MSPNVSVRANGAATDGNEMVQESRTGYARYFLCAKNTSSTDYAICGRCQGDVA